MASPVVRFSVDTYAITLTRSGKRPLMVPPTPIPQGAPGAPRVPGPAAPQPGPGAPIAAGLNPPSFVVAYVGQDECATIVCRGTVPHGPMGTMKCRFTVHFLPTGITVPPNGAVTAGPNMQGEYTGDLYVPVEQYAWYLDMLRNEGPLWAVLAPDTPELVALTSGAEAVGEEESIY